MSALLHEIIVSKMLIVFFHKKELKSKRVVLISTCR